MGDGEVGYAHLVVIVRTVNAVGARFAEASLVELAREPAQIQVTWRASRANMTTASVSRGWPMVSAPARTALAARDGHCRSPGCERPASWSAAHHVVHWIHGGTTDLDNLVRGDDGRHARHSAHDFLRAAAARSWLQVVAADRSQVVEDPHAERDDRGDRKVYA